MGEDYVALGSFFSSVWDVFNTPMSLPWIGSTSPLKIILFLAVLGFLVDLVNGWIGGKNSE